MLFYYAFLLLSCFLGNLEADSVNSYIPYMENKLSIYSIVCIPYQSLFINIIYLHILDFNLSIDRGVAGKFEVVCPGSGYGQGVAPSSHNQFCLYVMVNSVAALHAVLTSDHI